MRVVKDAEVRKGEILDAAAALFSQKGFDHTSTRDILQAVGIARGTLYHHFKSKEEIMDALIARHTERLLAQARQAAQDTAAPVEQRVLRTVMALHVDEAEGTDGKAMLDHLHKPQNALMHQKTKRILLRQVPQLFCDILKDGIAQGLYETAYPLECMEMAVCYLDTVLDEDVFELTARQRRVKVEALIWGLERLLGVQAGRFAFIAQAFGEGDGGA